MALLRGVVGDNGNIVKAITDLQPSEDDFVGVEVWLPDYVDETSMLAMYKRMLEVQKATGAKLRILGKTTNLDVEKHITRLFDWCENIYVTIDWRDS